MRGRLSHETPPLYFSDIPVFFMTVCAKRRGENVFSLPQPGDAILDSIRFRHEKRAWHCPLAVVMPDHVHLILQLPDGASLSTIMGDWKRFLTRSHGVAWQRSFFDHRIRKGENYGQKMEYVFLNPERAGLVEKAEDWPYTWMAED